MIKHYIGIGLAAIVLAACGSQTPEGHLAEAKKRLAKNEPAAAIIELKNALQKNPKMAEARLLLGVALIESGDPVGAEVEVRRALEYGVASADAVAPLARAMVSQGKYKNVIAQFSGQNLGSPERQADLATSLGEAQRGLGQPKLALEEFTKALALRPGYAPALLGTARAKAMAGDAEGALASAKAALDAAPGSLAARQFEGDLLTALGRLEDALASYRQALKLHPKSVVANAGTVGLLIELNKLDEAEKQLAVLKQIAPKHMDLHFAQANYEYRRKNITNARESIRQYLAAQPDSLRGFLLAAAIEYEAKAYPQAEEHLLRALARAPNLTPARRLLVSNHMKAGKHQEAVAALRPLLAGAEKDAVTLSLAGEAHLANGSATTAETYFTKASQLNPADQRTLTGLALSHYAQGRVDEAFRELEQASASDAEGRADVALYMTAMRQRDYDRALAATDSLEKKYPKKPAAHNLRGQVLLAKGDTATARKSFERALELDAAYVPAAANLARLDLRDNNPDAAQKRFESVLAKNPKSSEALLGLAEIKSRAQAKPDEIASLITRAIAANPQSILARLALIQFHLRSNQASKAVAAAQDAQAAIPDRPEILDASGRAFEYAKSSQQALAAYSRWARLQPASPVPHVRMANVHVAGNDFVAAEASLRKALEIKPDFVDAQRYLVALDLQRNRKPQALETARLVQKQRPKEATGYVLEGDVHASAKAWPLAITAYRTGLKQADSVDLAIRLHGALRAVKSPEAESFALERVKKHPGESAFRAYLAESALAAGNYAASVEHYNALLAAQPNNAMYLNNLAFAAGRTNDPRAIEYAERAVKLDPNNPNVLDTLGVLLVEKGDATRGIELLKKAAALPPQAPRIRLNLAKGLIKTGQKAAAKSELEALSQLGTNFAARGEVEKLLKEL